VVAAAGVGGDEAVRRAPEQVVGGSGSGSVTSRKAAAICLLYRAAISACWSTVAPRPML
jgi:hypothetical protein